MFFLMGLLSLNSNSGGNVGRLVLRDFFNNPHLLREPGVIDAINKGLLTQPIQRFDNFVTTEVSTEYIFQLQMLQILEELGSILFEIYS